MRCAADLWMNHEEQAAAVDSQPWKRSTSTQDIGEINRPRLSRDAFQGASALPSSPVWSLELG
jgi:hypothetical protein